MPGPISQRRGRVGRLRERRERERGKRVSTHREMSYCGAAAAASERATLLPSVICSPFRTSVCVCEVPWMCALFESGREREREKGMSAETRELSGERVE